MTNFFAELKVEKKFHLLKSKHRTQRLLLYYITVNMLHNNQLLFDTVQNILAPMAIFSCQFSFFVQ